MRAVVFVAVIVICQAEPWVRVKRQNIINKRSTCGYMDFKESKTLLECARSCSERSDCMSLFYINLSGECQRNRIMYSESIPVLAYEPSTEYWVKEGIECVPTPKTCPPTSSTNFTTVVLPGCYETFSYRIYTDAPRNFWQSKTKCEAECGKLVSILTLAKMDYMRHLTTCADYKNLDYWSDGLYNANKAIWETTGGTPLPMSQGDFWDYERPNEANFNGQCVWVKQHHNYYFDDNSCEVAMPRTVCELA